MASLRERLAAKAAAATGVEEDHSGRPLPPLGSLDNTPGGRPLPADREAGSHLPASQEDVPMDFPDQLKGQDLQWYQARTTLATRLGVWLDRDPETGAILGAYIALGRGHDRPVLLFALPIIHGPTRPQDPF